MALATPPAASEATTGTSAFKVFGVDAGLSGDVAHDVLEALARRKSG